MKFSILIFFISLFSLNVFSQNAENVLFKIDNEPYYTSEFIRTYQKNQHLIQDSSNNSIAKNLDLFVDYKLKVKSARDLGLDTLKSYKSELKQYRNSLVLPYLKDEKVTDKLVKEAYDRLLKEINASHILIFVNEDASPSDTLAAYNKIVEARDLIINDQDFAEIAKKYSQDPSAQENGGDLGYFTALQMVYSFENVAFSTQVGEVSMPFRTKFGYHILKVNDIRPSKGEVEVAHIMLKKTSDNAKTRIDSIYNVLLVNPAEFDEMAIHLSEDYASAPNKGRLNKFSAGQMIESFSNVAFSMQTIGEISKPFETLYGWHIVKLLNKYPIESFEVLEPKLKLQVERDERSNLIGKSVVDQLSKEYTIKVNNEALNQFKEDDWKTTPEKFQQKILSIEKADYFQSDFIKYLNTVNNISVQKAFEGFKESEVLNYYKENIQNTNPEFAATYKEFEDGLLLFEMLEREIWEKSKDSVGLEKFYNENKTTKYKDLDFKKNKGIVISDYQNYLEKMWIISLHQKYKVVFNEAQKNQILEAKLD